MRMAGKADLGDSEPNLLIGGRAPQAFCDERREEGCLIIGKRPERIGFSCEKGLHGALIVSNVDTSQDPGDRHDIEAYRMGSPERSVGNPFEIHRAAWRVLDRFVHVGSGRTSGKDQNTAARQV
jgi:hypothetical protein